MRIIILAAISILIAGCAKDRVLVKKSSCQDLDGLDQSNCELIQKL